MINGKVEQFLDTGWYSEATLYYKGFVYWCEAKKENNLNVFFVDRWRASCEDKRYYHSLTGIDGEIEWDRVLELKDVDMDKLKRKFLESKVFDGQTFWEVENDIAWVEEAEPIKNSLIDRT